MQDEEIFEIVDEEGRPVGLARRSQAHSNPGLIHRSVHVLVFSAKGELFLQKRAPDKDIQPGKWDTSVGGHVDPGESVGDAAAREMREELGLQGVTPEFLYSYIMRSEVETELVSTFVCSGDREITVNRAEISEGCFWPLARIEAALGSGIFSPNFEEEYARYKEYLAEKEQ